MNDSDSPSQRECDDIFIGHGEMAQLMRQHDWAATPLGPCESWPSALKTAMRLLLTSRFEMWLGWGPGIQFFYNDAYRPTLGGKHPRSLGMATRELWPEIWDDIEPRFRKVYDQGEATWDRALLLLLNRHGYAEETYHTFSYSPLLGDTGKVEGVFCAVTEETSRVIGERRMASLRDLGTRLAAARGLAESLPGVCASLALNDRDMPFALVYLFDEQGRPELRCHGGLPTGHPLTSADAQGRWRLDTIWSGRKQIRVPLGDHLAAPTGAWDAPPREALVVPLLGQGTTRPLGAMVVGLNPFLKLDADYQDFLSLLAGQLAAGLASAAVFDAERGRALLLSTEIDARTAELDRMHQLFREAPSFMCVLEGPEHVFQMVNQAYRQLVGHRQLEGLTVRDALPEIAGQGYFELLDKVFHTRQPFTGRGLAVSVQRKPGEPLEQRFVNLVYQPIVNGDGSVTGIFVDGHDVTHQKLAEDSLHRLNTTLERRVVERTSELQDALAKLQRESEERRAVEVALQRAQKMEALGALTGGVAHDFNNLLQVISGNLQLLARHFGTDEWARRRVDIALSGVSRGAKLASQLLAFGRRQPLEPKVLNAGRLVRGIDDMLRRTLGEEIELETVVAGGLWNMLADPVQLENAILNLAINARDAMEGAGKLTIEASNASLDADYARSHDDVKPGQYVQVSVTDTGSGMAAQVLERAFEPFFSTKPEGKGTGLGLSMVYGFVKQSGGHIKIYSEVGEGTTIKLYFPRSHTPEDQIGEVPPALVDGGDETILVVEDDDEVRETAVVLLQDFGYRVLKARDAANALVVIDSGVPIDLLFTDVVMPGPIRSPELARRALERVPDIAVLFTSGYTENAIVHGGRLDPGVELLSKPYTREALGRRVRHLLANRAQRISARTSMSSGAAPAAAIVLPTVDRAPHVLLVEDDPLIRSVTRELVELFGFRVTDVANYEEAFEKLQAATFDVLLTDLWLAGPHSGLDLARQALGMSPRIRVIFATGDLAGVDLTTMPGAQLLAKPFTEDDLEAVLLPASGAG